MAYLYGLPSAANFTFYPYTLSQLMDSSATLETIGTTKTTYPPKVVLASGPALTRILKTLQAMNAPIYKGTLAQINSSHKGFIGLVYEDELIDRFPVMEPNYKVLTEAQFIALFKRFVQTNVF